MQQQQRRPVATQRGENLDVGAPHCRVGNTHTDVAKSSDRFSRTRHGSLGAISEGRIAGARYFLCRIEPRNFHLNRILPQ